MHDAVASSYAYDRLLKMIVTLQAEFIEHLLLAASREALLREEVEKWKSHRDWSDKIVRAYLDEIEKHNVRRSVE